jgi:ribosomal protein S12 methylthiotransferase
LITLGCDKNTVDSEKILATLVANGARVSSEIEGSDVVLVNTCGFIQSAKEQSLETILQASELRESGSVKALVVVGCMVERYKLELKKEIPEVDLFLGLTEMASLIPELRSRGILEMNLKDIPIMERPLRILESETPHTSFLKISEGCDHTCAFCAIPSFRGLHRSAPLKDLVLEAQGLSRIGVREVNIISQDTTWYGRDLKRTNPDAPLLPELLSALVQDTDIPWLRLFYMYPSGITQDMVELIGSENSILPYLDMPIQHGSDRILKLMRRPENQEVIRERVRWLRDLVPDLTLRTTVIVGFPGETEDDFQQMMDFLEEISFERVGVFTYSLEDGTAAAEMPDRVPESLMADRLEQVMDLQRDISAKRNANLVGSKMEVLVDEVLEDSPYFQGEGTFGMARTKGQATDVDGVTHLYSQSSLKPGEFVTVEIQESEDYDLIGKVEA